MNKKILEREIIGIIAKTLKVNNSKIKKNLSIGSIHEWDSLMHLNIFFSLKKKYKKLELDKAAEVKSVNDWIKLIKNEYHD
tara:strand:+ start:45 stop:287 length:243 start_codon:yes stop_codon:yes gene_type:complete